MAQRRDAIDRISYNREASQNRAAKSSCARFTISVPLPTAWQRDKGIGSRGDGVYP
jgi:hypothetical protein